MAGWPQKAPVGLLGGEADGVIDRARLHLVPAHQPGEKRKACRIGRKLRDLGVRKSGIVRIDSAASAADWAKDPEANTKRIAQTFREACAIAEDFGEIRLVEEYPKEIGVGQRRGEADRLGLGKSIIGG